jgi:hypothetical protein
MNKQIQISLLSAIFLPAALFGQSIYIETGLNAFSKINYSNSNGIDYTSEQSKAQFRSELGFKYALTKKLKTNFGVSKEQYSFILDQETPMMNISSHFELDYLGINVGLDYLIHKKNKFKLFACSTFSGNFLSRGERIDRLFDEEVNSLNLIDDPNFSQMRYDAELGLSFNYTISYLASVYASYKFNQSITAKENNLESYNFNAHVFSIGLVLPIRQYVGKIERNTDDVRYDEPSSLDLIVETDTVLAQDTTLALHDELIEIDSTRVKIYFPPNSFEFYNSHLSELDKIAEDLLENTSMRYKITAYYDRNQDEIAAQNRLNDVLNYFNEKGVPQPQLITMIVEEYDPYSKAENVWSRRVELIKIK